MAGAQNFIVKYFCIFVITIATCVVGRNFVHSIQTLVSEGLTTYAMY